MWYPKAGFSESHTTMPEPDLKELDRMVLGFSEALFAEVARRFGPLRRGLTISDWDRLRAAHAEIASVLADLYAGNES